MARVQTGHIHLGSSILHHTEGWETKSLKKKNKKKKTAGTHRRTALSTPACMHCTQTHKQRKGAPPLRRRYKNTCDHAVYILKSLKNRKYILYVILSPAKILQTDTHTHAQTDT